MTLLGLLAEERIHAGTGQQTGYIDQPVAREKGTGYPIVAGSGHKGGLREKASGTGWEIVFGDDEQAGTLLVSEVNLLALPVRSLHSAYKWVTCPHVLERLERTNKRGNTNLQAFQIPSVADGNVLANGVNGSLYLEENQLSVSGTVPHDLVELVKAFIPHSSTRDRVEDQLVVVSNSDFAWFTSYALEVRAHNSLARDSKKSLNLWYAEYLPVDTLMYSMYADVDGESEKKAVDYLKDAAYLRLGGDETTGAGTFAVQVIA